MAKKVLNSKFLVIKIHERYRRDGAEEKDVKGELTCLGQCSGKAGVILDMQWKGLGLMLTQ